MLESLSLLFIVTSLVLIITPGQDMMLVMSRSIAQGWKAGVVTAAGVSTGLLGHSLLASLGLGAVLGASEIIFVTIKYVGAEHPTIMLFALGVAFAVLTFIVKGPVGHGAGVLSAWLRSRPAVLSWINRTSGVVLVALGIRLALERRS